MEIYKDLSNPSSKEFEQLLNNQLSKIKLTEGTIVEGKIKCKFGKTSQRPKRREGGGNYPTGSFDIRIVVNVKKNCENELRTELNKLEYLKFEAGGEVFMIPPERGEDVESKFLDVTRKEKCNFIK